MKQLKTTTAVIVVLTLLSFIPQVLFSQQCSSYIKNFSSLSSGECKAITTDDNQNMYALIDQTTKFLLKLDQNGNQVWLKTRPEPLDFYSMENHNGSLYILAGKGSGSVCKLLVYDLDGNQINSRDIPSSEISYPVKMVVTNTGLYVAGKRSVALFNFDLTTVWKTTISVDNQDVKELATNYSGKVCLLTYRDYDSPDYYHYYYISLISVSDQGVVNVFKQEELVSFGPESQQIQGLVVYDDRATFDQTKMGYYVSYFNNYTHSYDFNGTEIATAETEYIESITYDKYKNVALNGRSWEFNNAYPGNLNIHGLNIRSKGLSETPHIVQIDFDNNQGTYFKAQTSYGDGVNTYMAVKGDDSYINQFLIKESGGIYFIKLTSDYCLIPNEPIYAGADREIFCGDQTTIGVDEFNPLASGGQLFSAHSWDWIENGLPNNYKATLTDPKNGYYHIKVKSGICSVMDSVLVQVNKQTNFSYVVTGKTIKLTRIEPSIENFTWDFGNGVTNTINPSPVYTYPDSGAYSVCLTGLGIPTECISCATLQIPGHYSGSTLIPTGIKEDINSDPEIKLFPNPASGIVEVITEDSFPVKEMIIFNQTGQSSSILFDKTDVGYRIDVSNLSGGIYILYVKGVRSAVKSKLIVY